MARAEMYAIHVCARIRAMRSDLFSRAQIEDILEGHDLAATIDRLLASPYKQEMAEALTRYQGANAVEDAVTRNMVRTFRRLAGYRRQSRFQELAQLFLARWDLAAVKALLRARHHDVAGDAARATFFPGPTLTAALLEDLAGRPSMPDLVAGLAAWNANLGGCLANRIQRYAHDHDLPALEDVLDRRYFVENAQAAKTARDENSQQVRTVLRMEIDRINLRALFRLIDAKAGPDAIMARMLPEGTLSQELLARMAEAPNIAEVMELLGTTSYRELVEVLYHFVQTRLFSPIERHFELALMHGVRRLARRYPLGIAVLMDYAWQKYNEVANLRLIARSEARYLPRGRVREELLYV